MTAVMDAPRSGEATGQGARRAAQGRAEADDLTNVWTYTTIEGDVLDLTGLTNEERAFFRRCYRAYQEGSLGWPAFSDLVMGRENPLVRASGGLVTRAVMAHPLYQAVHDLENRVGLRTGELAAEPEYDLARDPLADTWLMPSDAAARKGVTRTGLHQAIRRGAVVARAARPGGRWTLVSANSLERWTPAAARQRAGRARARSKAARRGTH